LQGQRAHFQRQNQVFRGFAGEGSVRVFFASTGLAQRLGTLAVQKAANRLRLLDSKAEFE
jgi:hypothetical protein